MRFATKRRIAALNGNVPMVFLEMPGKQDTPARGECSLRGIQGSQRSASGVKASVLKVFVKG
jgi:hypothetical protein